MIIVQILLQSVPQGVFTQQPQPRPPVVVHRMPLSFGVGIQRHEAQVARGHGASDLYHPPRIRMRGHASHVHFPAGEVDKMTARQTLPDRSSQTRRWKGSEQRAQP